MRASRVVLVALAGAALAGAAWIGVAVAGVAKGARIEPARRLAIGFQDDPSFRWSSDRVALLDDARSANARVIRTLVDWSVAAPTRPRHPADPFDPAYRLGDVDELLRQAQLRGIDVLVTIWGTPAWANGGAGRNHLPTRLQDLTDFAHAVAARWSGSYPSEPRVRYFTVWNEPNLEQFLAPQFTPSGADAAPALYAELYRAAWKGLKAGNAQALVGIGETSPWGRDHRASGTTQETHSPARFAELVAKADPTLPFDAWAHHPYPTSLGLPPEQKSKWPNVSLTALPRFSQQLDRWFHRKDTPIWITEYGYQTRRPAAFGVTAAEQATYGVRALQIAAANPDVQMFVWFVLRDATSTPWRSGLIGLDGKRKPAFARFAAAAAPLDVAEPVLSASAGSSPLQVPVETMVLAAHDGPGAQVGVTWRAWDGKGLVAVNQARVTIGTDGRVVVPVGFTRKAGKTYRVTLDVNDVNGLTVSHTAQVAVGGRGPAGR